MKQLSLNEKHQTVATENGIMSSKLHHLEDRYSKEVKEISEKVERETKRVRELEDSLKNKEKINLELAEKEKKLLAKLEEYGDNEGEYSDLIRRYEK